MYRGSHGTDEGSTLHYGEKPTAELTGMDEVLVTKEIQLWTRQNTFEKIEEYAYGFRRGYGICVATTSQYVLEPISKNWRQHYVYQMDRVEAEVRGLTELQTYLFIHASENQVLYVSVVNGTIFTRSKTLNQCLHLLEPSLRDAVTSTIVFSELSTYQASSAQTKLFPNVKSVTKAKNAAMKGLLSHKLQLVKDKQEQESKQN